MQTLQRLINSQQQNFNTHDPYNAQRVTFLLIWLIRKYFSPAKYSSNTVCTIYSNNYTELDDVRVVPCCTDDYK